MRRLAMLPDRAVVIICLVGLLIASVLAVYPYACTRSEAGQPPSELVLDCTKTEGQIVMGFIRGGHVTRPSSAKKQKQLPAATECTVPDNKTACWANPIDGPLLSDIQECLWKEAFCRIPVNGQLLGYPCFAQPSTYLFAEQFECIHQSRIVHLCSRSEEKPKLSVKLYDREIFMLSKGYPELVVPNLDCNLTITTDAESMRFESVYMHIHPRRKKHHPVESCDFDYLEIKPSATGSADGVRFCGTEEFVYTVPGTSRVRFVSGPEKKHYGGFVVKVTASTEDKKAPAVAVSSYSNSKVADTAGRKLFNIVYLITLTRFWLFW